MRKRIFREGRANYTQQKQEELTYERPIGDHEEDEKKEDWHDDRDLLMSMFRF